MRIARGVMAGAIACLALGAAGDLRVSAVGQGVSSRQPPSRPGYLSRSLPAGTAPALAVLAERFDERAAMDLVLFMDEYLAQRREHRIQCLR